MKIEINNKTKNKPASSIVKRTITGFLLINKLKKLEVSVALIGDKSMKKLNKHWRGKDRVTDVLSFPDKFLKNKKIFVSKDDYYLGELVLNIAQIKRQAKNFKNSFKQELQFICVHGLLHLLGYEDKTIAGRKIMDKKTKEILAKTKL